MEKEEFLQQYQNDTNKYSLMDLVYGEFVRYCRSNNITDDDLTTEELEAIAEEVAQNGI